MNSDFDKLKYAVVKLLVEPNDELNVGVNQNELKEWLVENIEWLIDNDFERLLTILYRIDVSEIKIKRLIEQNEGENAAEIIAELILERELQKIESRKRYSTPKNSQYFNDEAETWD